MTASVAAVSKLSLLPLLLLALTLAPASADLPLCDATICTDWIDNFGGNVTELKHGELFALEFAESEVTNLWQVTACGDVFGYPSTYGEFELFVLDDVNLHLALQGKPFFNCSCGDIEGDMLDNEPTTSTCVSVTDADPSDIASENALECDNMHEGTAMQTTCTNVAVRCVSANRGPNGTAPGCRIGLSVQVLRSDPFLDWWSFEYIPIVFGFCLVVIFVGVVSRRLRRQRQRAALLRLLGGGTPLLGGEGDVDGAGGGGYGSGRIVAEGTVVDAETLPTGTYIAGTPATNRKPVAAYFEGNATGEKIFQADLEQPPSPKASAKEHAEAASSEAAAAASSASSSPTSSNNNNNNNNGGGGALSVHD